MSVRFHWLWLFSVLSCGFMTVSVDSFYFYLDTSAEKCFIEELPHDTLVVGHYKAEQWLQDHNAWMENSLLGIRIVVREEVTGNTIKDQRAGSSGRFAFTAGESSAYQICLTTNNTGWFSHERARIHLDIVVGDAANDEQQHKGEKLNELTVRVRDLNYRIGDIRREQQYQRERETEFRNISETANARVVWWTLLQQIVLGITCVWQMRHLKTFFETKKLV